MKALFVEKQWSAGQISKFSGWPKTSVIEALKAHDITRDPKAPTKVRFGWKVEDGNLVPHVRQQLVIGKILKLRDREKMSFNQIAKALNIGGIPTLSGKKWEHKTIKAIVARSHEGVGK